MLFRSAFSDPKAVAALVAPSLPAALVQRTDWKALSPVATDLVSRGQDESHCDLVFEAPLHTETGGRRMLLHLHVEHQSKNDPSMVLRTLDYGGSLLLKHHRNYGQDKGRPTPPLLVPVVVSHDPKGWSAATHLEELYELDEELRSASQAFRTQHGYLVIDLSRFDEAQDRERASDGFRHLVLVALREARMGSILECLSLLAEIVDVVANLPHSGDHFHQLTCYICHVSRDPEVTPETVTQKLASASPAAKGAAAASWARITETWHAEGREEGREQALRETLLSIAQDRFGVVSPDQTCRIESASIPVIQGWIRACASGSWHSLDELLDGVEVG